MFRIGVPAAGQEWHALTERGCFCAVTCDSSSRREPMSLVNVELHRAVVAHLQQERLAVVLIPYIHALHDFESLQGLFAKSD
jgi:hypothetical protein